LQLPPGVADHVAVTTAAPSPPSPWLFGPRSDLLFGCGLLYTLVFGVFVFAGPEIRSVQPIWLAAALTLLLGTPHYGATLVRVYERRRDRSSYVVFSLWATLAVIALFVTGLWVPAAGSFLVTLYLTWSPWHYTGQNYGLAVMFLRRGGVALDPGLKRWLYLSFLLSFVLVFVSMHTADHAASDVPAGYASLGVGFQALGIPVAVAKPVGAAVFAAYVFALARSVWGFRQAPRRVLLPVALLSLSQILWFSLPFALQTFGVAPRLDVLSFDFRTHYFIWIAAAHSLQYLWVTAYYARQAGNWRGQLPNYLRVFAAGAAAWTLPALVFGPHALGPLAFDHGLGILIAAAVNVHHFILDGAIWKLRGRIAEVLIRSRSEAPGEEGGRVALLRPLVWTACAALLLVDVLLGVGDQLFVRDVEAKNYQRASRLADWLGWGGRERASWRLEFGERLLRDRHFGAAREQLRLSETLAPKSSANARVLIGMSYEAQQDWRQAAEAYEAALADAREGADRAATLGRAGRAWLGAGEPTRALPLLEQALAQDPADASLRALLERARAAAGATSAPAPS
jgi:tetratricopeptide (TPR) repeat protein